MTTPFFAHQIESEQGIRSIIPEPADIIKKKQLPALDKHCKQFISLCPYLLIGTTNVRHECDVSPRGDPPGFVHVLDDRHFLIPDRPGNRRIDSLRNIMETGSIGILFLIPGIEDMLRVNGKACLTKDPALLEKMTVQGKTPLLAIGVEVVECFLHCAKALKRSSLWDPKTWPNKTAMPSLACMVKDQIYLPDTTVEELEKSFAESYAKRLY